MSGEPFSCSAIGLAPASLATLEQESFPRRPSILFCKSINILVENNDKEEKLARGLVLGKTF
jgi:hypothetical protein